MPQPRAEIAAEQPGFYTFAYRKVVLLLFALLIIAYGLIGVVIYQHITRPVPQYFVTTSDGRLVEIEAINEN